VVVITETLNRLNDHSQWAKSPKKSSLKECAFDNSAAKIQCYIVKNTLLQTAFSAVLTTGLVIWARAIAFWLVKLSHNKFLYALLLKK